jgi:hypothetical protein
VWLATSLLTGDFAGAAMFNGPADAADIEEDPAAALRLSRKSARACTDGCMTECRDDRKQCTDSKADDVSANKCPAQFQICVRRCVISCSPK